MLSNLIHLTVHLNIRGMLQLVNPLLLLLLLLLKLLLQLGDQILLLQQQLSLRVLRLIVPLASSSPSALSSSHLLLPLSLMPDACCCRCD